MAKEAIEKIRLAEEEARKLVFDAQTKSRELLKAAEEQAKANDADIMAQANREALELKAKARQQAEKSVEGVLEDGKAAVGEILEIKDSEIDKAAQAILERIVKTNGNS